MRKLLFIASLLFAPLCFAQTVTFVGSSAIAPTPTDAVLQMNGGSNPSYGSASVTGASTYTWSDGVTTWFSGGSFTVNVSFTDSAKHQFTLYVVDDDSTVRTETISVAGATQPVSNFHAGLYFTWNITGPGTIPFTIKNTGPSNAVLTKIIFATATTPVTCPVPVHSAVLGWQPVPGATSYVIFDNGNSLGAAGMTASPTYFIGGLVAGSTHIFSVASVNSAGTSAPSPLPSLTVPSP